jgi:drug/metabolite transporter (DMT)-like permease
VTPTPEAGRHLLGEAASILCALVWAVSVLLWRRSGRSYSPVAQNLYKGGLALLLYAPTLLLLGTPVFPAGQTAVDWGTLLASGAIGIGIADSLFFASLNRLGAGRSAIVNCCYSPFVVLFARLYLDEPIRLTLAASLALMTASLLLVAREAPRAAAAPTEPAPPPRAVAIGVTLGVASMLLMAIAIVLAKPVLDRSEILWATVVRVAGGELLLLLQTAPSRRHRAAVLQALRPGRHHLLLAPAGFLGSYLGMLFWIAGMKLTPVGIAGVLNQTSTLFVPLLAAIFLGEPLTPRKSVALLLGFAGAVVAAL